VHYEQTVRGRVAAAAALLLGATAAQCRYLFALCCYDLKKLPEAESALSGSAACKAAAAAAAADHGAAPAEVEVPNGRHLSI